MNAGRLALTLSLVLYVTAAQPAAGQLPESVRDPRATGGQAPNTPWSRDGHLQPGDPAPDFELKRLHAEGRFRPLDFRNKKPLALIFGSYT